MPYFIADCAIAGIRAIDVKLHFALFVDVCDESTINVAKEKVDDILGDQGLNLLINNAGILPREQTIEDVTVKTLMETYNVNVVGTIRVCKVKYKDILCHQQWLACRE